MIRSRLTALLSAAALASCASLEPAPTYVNPVLDRDFPDPAVLRADDGWFYAYATQSTAAGTVFNLQVARSRDLVSWEHLGEALPAKPRWAASTWKFWAPHVIHDREQRRYVMYYSAEPDSAKGKCLAVASSPLPSGPFVDAGEPLLCGEGIENIDPMAFDDPKSGKRLLYWGSGGKPIRVQELDADRLRFAPGSEPKAVLHPVADEAYRTLIEGAWVLYRDGAYYLFFSGDRCCGAKPNYALMVARSTDALGPFEPLARPILEKNVSWDAPGHNSIVADDAGTDWILYHAMRAAPNRLLLLDRLVWRDGWPRVEGDQPSVSRQSAPELRR